MSRIHSILLASLVWVAPAQAALDLLNGMAAQVNDAVVTFEDVQGFARRAMETAARRARTQTDFDQDSVRIQKEALDQLIDRRLIVQEFRKSGYNLPEAIIDDLVKDRVKREFGDRVTLTKMLRESGRTYETFRQEEKDALVVYQMVRKNVAQEIVISPKKIERYYAQNGEKFRVGDRSKVRIILIDARRHARGEPKMLAQAVLGRLKAGEDFAKVADEVSDDSRTNKGGDRGWIEAKDTTLRKELHELAFQLNPGELSEVLELDGSAFILKVEERKSAEVRPISEVRLEIEEALKQSERDRLQKAWIERLRKKAYIRYF